MTDIFERTLDTGLANVPALADAFANWSETAKLVPQDVSHVNLVLEELVTNAIRHGLGEERPGWIRVRVERHDGYLALELRDSARPFDPFKVPPPDLTLDVEKRQVGGLGVHFVRAFMDEWQYERQGDENVVSLIKRLQRDG